MLEGLERGPRTAVSVEAPPSVGTGSSGLVVAPLGLDHPGLLDRWGELAAASGNVFATPEWLLTWWDHFGRGRPLLLAGAWRGGTLVAILPLYLAARFPVRIVRLLGHGPTDVLGPVCAAEDRGAAMSAMVDHLATGGPRGWDVAILDELAPSIDWADRAGVRVLAQSRSRSVALTGRTGEDWFASRSRNLRDQLRKAERRLARQGRVTERSTSSVADLDRDLDLLLALHARRWAAAGGSRAYAGRVAFHRAVAALALDRGWLRLRLLEVDGRPVAGLHSFRFQGVESSYQAGRDPAFDRWSVGLLAHARAIRACADEGVDAYRFLRGDEPYEARLSDETEHVDSVALARTGQGRAVEAAVRHLPRLTREQRRLVPASLAWGTGGSPRWWRP